VREKGGEGTGGYTPFRRHVISTGSDRRKATHVHGPMTIRRTLSVTKGPLSRQSFPSASLRARPASVLVATYLVLVQTSVVTCRDRSDLQYQKQEVSLRKFRLPRQKKKKALIPRPRSQMRCGVLVHACTDCATIAMIRSDHPEASDSPALLTHKQAQTPLRLLPTVPTHNNCHSLMRASALLGT
jgi:hypothetical protein